jgi:rubredoxin
MPRHLHDDDGMVWACPSCDVAGEVWERTHATKDFDHDFRCHKCGHEFDAAVERPTKNTAGNPTPTDRNGLPKNLSEDSKELIKQLRAD